MPKIRPSWATLAEDHFGPAHGKLIPFAAHGFDQHGQVQFTPARDDPLAGNVGVAYAQRDIVLQLHCPVKHILGDKGAFNRICFDVAVVEMYLGL